MSDNNKGNLYLIKSVFLLFKKIKQTKIIGKIKKKDPI